MDNTPLRNAFRELLDAAATVADSADPSPVPPAGEWNLTWLKIVDLEWVYIG